MKNLLSVGFFLCLLAGFFASCSAEQKQNAAAQIANVQPNNSTNRAAEAVAMSAAKGATEMGYKTLAAFKGGQATMDLAQIAALQDKNVSLVVLYESNATWAKPFGEGNFAKTGDDRFNGLLESYELSIVKHFELDEMNEGIVLEGAQGKVGNPVEAAREISMIDNVLMVEVKEVPQNTKTETVSTGK